jgi:adenosylhomocysteine nucleosidase
MLKAAAAAGPRQIVLLAALPWEVRPFCRLLKARRRRDLGLPAWEFKLERIKGLAALTGMGAEAARQAARRVLTSFRPEVLLSVGFGGALSPELPPGALVLGASLWQYDPDAAMVSPVSAPAPPRPFTELLARLQEAGLPAFAASLVSTPGIVAKQGGGPGLRTLEHAVLDLETAALADLAASEGLAFLALRALTDAAAEEIPDFIVAAGGQVGALEALGWLAADPRRLRDLLHLWRRSRLAAARLAQAIRVLLPALVAAGPDLQNQPAQEG